MEDLIQGQKGILWKTQREKEYVEGELEKLKEFSDEDILRFCESKRKDLPRLAKVEAKRRGLMLFRSEWPKY